MPRTRRTQSTRKRPATNRRRAATRATASKNGSILAWEDDPGQPPALRHPISRPVPKLTATSLPITIRGKAPAARQQDVGTPGFRYWANADALGRAAQFWAATLPSGTKWYRSNGARLPVQLDEDVDLNAFYDRNGLHFFHGTANGTTVYSAESPDVACHELGHAVLDALKPQLWDAMSGEVAAFHESFGDMSAMLSALQLKSVRQEVLAETSGRLDRTSRLSRLAEQLGWAIRQAHPDAVDPDCLRNASNSFFYSDPMVLPPSAPATQLSSEPHSFSRVFTGAFLEILSGMFRAQSKQDEAALLQAAQDAGEILVNGVKASPVVPTYYSQVAAHMLDVDLAQFAGRYRNALKSGFVRHGVLSLQAATTAPPPQEPRAARRALAAIAPGVEDAPLTRIALPATDLGLPDDLLVSAASHPKRFAVASAAPDVGGAESPGHDKAAASFLEDLVRRGRVDFGDHAVDEAAVLIPGARKTHEVVREQGQLVLTRRYFDCGFDCA
jgi:Thermolysin metallopeptidase, catalytic domain